MEQNMVNVYNPNDYVLLMNQPDSTVSSENQCPFCQYIITEGHSDKCFLHQSICNDYILPILVVILIALDIWWSHKEKRKK